MQRDTAVDLLMGRLGRRTNASLKNDIINEMVFVQETLLEGKEPLPWFSITSDATLVSVVDQETIALPSDFLKEWEDGGFWWYDSGTSKWVEVPRDDYDVIKAKYPNDERGTAQAYDRVEGSLLIRPIPDTVESFKLWYFAREESLAGVYGDAKATTENGWLKYASDLLIAHVGMILAGQYLSQRPDLVQSFAGQVGRAEARLSEQTTNWEESNKYRQMGDD